MLNRPWLRKTSNLSGKNLDQFFCLGNIIGQSPWFRKQVKFGSRIQRGPLGAQNPPMSIFRGKYFFCHSIENWKITQMNLKKQNNWSFFDPSHPKIAQNGSGYQWSAASPILSFYIFSGWGWSSWQNGKFGTRKNNKTQNWACGWPLVAWAILGGFWAWRIEKCPIFLVPGVWGPNLAWFLIQGDWPMMFPRQKIWSKFFPERMLVFLSHGLLSPYIFGLTK